MDNRSGSPSHLRSLKGSQGTGYVFSSSSFSFFSAASLFREDSVHRQTLQELAGRSPYTRLILLGLLDAARGVWEHGGVVASGLPEAYTGKAIARRVAREGHFGSSS